VDWRNSAIANVSRANVSGETQDGFPFLYLRRILEAPGRSVMGLTPTTEVDVLLATHGWWPWLLTFAVILIVLAGVIAYFVKRRRTI
jgi:hypothetical protein